MENLSLEGETTLPSGWRFVTRLIPIQLWAGRNDVILLSFSTPPETPSGDYTILFHVRRARYCIDEAELSVVVFILPVRTIELSFIDAPQFVVAGEKITATFQITNTGNSNAVVYLRPQTVGIDSVFLDNLQVELKPSESHTINATGVSRPNLKEKTHALIEIYAALKNDSTMQVHTSASTDIIPRGEALENDIYKFPVTVNIRGVAGDHSIRPQIEISGAAPCTQFGKDRLDILMRTPETLSQSILGTRDEYRIGYQSSAVDLYAGDRNYSLTPLTEYGRPAFGAGSRLSYSSLTVGGFYNETRFLSPIQKEAAGFVALKPWDVLTTSVNFLNVENPEQNSIMSYRIFSQPWRGSEAEIEYGRSNGDLGTGDAFYGRFLAQTKWLSGEIRRIDAQPNFGGYYRDLLSTSISLSLTPLQRFRIDGFYHDDQRNRNFDTTQYTAPRDRYFQIGCGYSDNLAVSYRWTDQQDLLPNPQYNTHDELLQIRPGVNFRWIGLLGDVDIEHTRDKLSGNEALSTRYSLNASINFKGGHDLSLLSEYADEVNPTTTPMERQKRVSFGLNGLLRLSEKTSLRGNVYGNVAQTSVTQTYTIIRCNVRTCISV